MREYDAHIEGHGKKDAMLNLVLSMFISHVSTRMWDTRNKLSVKSLRDKFESWVKKRKEINVCNDRASDIIQNVIEVDQLLNDLILYHD